jgi:hypothetical protein
MSADTGIFQHVMQKRIGNIEYWRKIVIVEEGPFVFRVVQEHELGRMESGDLRAAQTAIGSRSEWMCPSKEAATEQALRCLHQSKKDEWIFSPSASSDPQT